jgi:hypothetical protein
MDLVGLGYAPVGTKGLFGVDLGLTGVVVLFAAEVVCAAGFVAWAIWRSVTQALVQLVGRCGRLPGARVGVARGFGSMLTGRTRPRVRP